MNAETDMPTARTAQHVGRCGELLVQYKFLKLGIDSAPMTTDRGVDLLAIDPKTRRKTVTVQVKAATHRRDARAATDQRETTEYVSWPVPYPSATDYAAVVDVIRDKVWMFTKKEIGAQARGKGNGERVLWWYIPGHRPKKARSRSEDWYERYAMDTVVARMFPE